MMVRRLSLILPVLLAFGAMGTASAQPTQSVGPWSTLERVGEKLQDRQERKDEIVDRVEQTRPEFYSRNAGQLEQPLLLFPMRLTGWKIESATVESSPSRPRPVSTPSAPPPPPTSATSSVTPYQPLVLGSFFGSVGVTAVTAPAPVSTPAPVPAPAPAPKASPAPPTPPAPTRIEPRSPASVEVSSTRTKSAAAPPSPPARSRPRPADAFLNFSDGPYPGAGSLVEGSPAPWYRSPVVSDLLGRAPSPEERHDFKSDVLSKVENSFRRGGIEVDLIAEPGPAAHTLSVVSGATGKHNPEAIGIADIGGDGFTFLDNFDSEVIDSMDDLETAVANNVAHELMHTFGIDFHHDSGETIDSGTIRWDLLTDEDLAFSDDAVALLSSADFQQRWDDLLLAGTQMASHGQGCSCHPHGAHATPEPATLAMWGLTLAGLAWTGRRWRNGRA